MIPGKKFDRKYFSSGIYKDYKKLVSQWVEPVAKRISRFFQNKPSAKILDVGCGFGDLLAELQDKYNLEVAGLECSPYAVRKSITSVKNKIKKGSILTLPLFKKNSFDAVICFDVIYYFTFKETEKVIRNLVDISRGYIFFNSIYRHSRDASQKINPDFLRKVVLSKKEYIDIFSQNGAKLVESFYSENGGATLVFKKIQK